VEHFIKGLLFGMVLQISVGPVCIAVLQKGITESFREAFLMVWGVVAADSTYIVLALLGISSAMQFEPVRIVIGLAGAALLLYFGVQNLMTKEATFEHMSTGSKRGGSFRYGFLLTFSNPLTILFWAGVFGGLIASTQFPSSVAIYTFALGCIFSTLIFLTGIAALGRFVGTFLQRPSLLIWLNRAVGIFLIAFAVKLTLDVCSR
jgi:threonine/homoserine/homoserine lactone efflux protein